MKNLLPHCLHEYLKKWNYKLNKLKLLVQLVDSTGQYSVNEVSFGSIIDTVRSA